MHGYIMHIYITCVYIYSNSSQTHLMLSIFQTQWCKERILLLKNQVELMQTRHPVSDSKWIDVCVGPADSKLGL